MAFDKSSCTERHISDAIHTGGRFYRIWRRARDELMSADQSAAIENDAMGVKTMDVIATASNSNKKGEKERVK